jgi:cytidylate kinase
MSIITVSRGSYSRGKDVAEQLARELGYDCVSREVILEASEQFDVPEIQLVHAIEDAPSILNRLIRGKERYIAYVRAALLKRVQKGDVVYHGFAGHLLLRDVPSVLKVRVIAAMEDRIQEVVRRDGVTEDEARERIAKADHERQKWSHHLYGVDPRDVDLYDVVVRLPPLTVDDVVGTIKFAAQLPAFQTTPEVKKTVEALAARAEADAKS